MSQKSPTNRDQLLFAVVDAQTLAEVDRIAAKYGAPRDEVLLELLRLHLTEPMEEPTLH